jgi:hypothetical protein
MCIPTVCMYMVLSILSHGQLEIFFCKVLEKLVYMLGHQPRQEFFDQVFLCCCTVLLLFDKKTPILDRKGGN